MEHEGSGGDTPFGGLPPADRVLLAKPEIEVALVEVRFAAGQAEIGIEEGLSLRDQMRGRGVSLPRMQPTQQQQVAITATSTGTSSQLEVQSSGWQFASADGHLVVIVLPETVAVQVTRYERWSVSLSPVLDSLLRAVAATLNPELVHRVGVRYVNRLTQADAVAPLAWMGSINPMALGLIADDVLGPLVAGTQQQLELRLGDTQGALVRHGAFADGAARGQYSYLVDIDVFEGATTRFDPGATLATARLLNRTALPIFQRLVTPDYRQLMQPYAELDESGAVVAAPAEAGRNGGEGQ